MKQFKDKDIVSKITNLPSSFVLTTRTGVLLGPFPTAVNANTVILYKTYSFSPVMSF